MADLNRHLRKNKILIFFTIFAYLYMSCFTSCSKSKTPQRSGQTEQAARGDEARRELTAEAVASGIEERATQVLSVNHFAPEKLMSREEMTRRGQNLEKLFAELRQAGSEIPRETFDPRAIVDTIGQDPDALFRWVRDRTSLVAYRGVLRGPIGVLMDRVGNSLDRSLLLHELIRLAGFDAQLAHGTLTEGQAQEIFSRATPIPEAFFGRRPQSLGEADLDFIEKVSAEYGLERTEIFNAVKTEEQRREQIAQAIEEGMRTLVPRVEDLAKKYQQNNAAGEKKKILESLQDHWWVRYQKESSWVDLDPTLPDTESGKSLTEAEETNQPDGLDADLYHRVTIRVIIEQWKNKELTEHEVLQHSIQPGEAFGKRIAFYHSAEKWPENLDFLKQKQPREYFDNLVLGQKSWQPTLQYGSEAITQVGFTETGETAEGTGQKKTPRGSVGIVGGLAGALTGRREETPAADDSLLTAEWIEYEVYSPGEEPQKIRREIFDLIGPAGRLEEEVPRPEVTAAWKMQRNLALLGTTEIRPLACQPADDYIRFLANANLLSNEETMLAFFQPETWKNPEDILRKMSELRGLPVPLFLLARDRNGPDHYLASPNILAFHSYFYAGPDGRWRPLAALDIVANRVAVSSGKIENAFHIRLAQGVRDSLRESIFSAPSGAMDTLSKLHQKMDEENIGWLVLNDPEDSALKKSALSKDLQARLQTELRQGQLVLVPKKPVLIDGQPVVQWWRINAQTGETLIIGEHGWGQAMTEFIEDVELVIQLYDWVMLVGSLLECIRLEIAISFAVEKGEAAGKFIECLQKVLCNYLWEKFEDYCDLETNWTNFIIKKLAAALAEVFCEKLLESEE